MSFRLYTVRRDLRIQATIGSKGAEYFVIDPVKLSYFKVKFLQYEILRFFQAQPATAEDASRYLDERCDLEVDADQIASFMERMRGRLLLEPNRSVKLTPIQAIKMSSSFREEFYKYFRSGRTIDDGQKDILAEVFLRIRQWDPVGAVELLSKKYRENSDNEGIEYLYRTFRDRLIANMEPEGGGSMETHFIDHVRLFDPDKLLRFLYPFIRFLFSKSGLVLLAALYGSALLLYMERFDLWVGQFTEVVKILAQYPVLTFLMMQFSAIVHEMGHASICHYMGGRVRSIGLIFFFSIFPGMYADVTDSYTMTLRRRVAVMLGGVFGQSVLWALCVITYAILPEDSILSLYMIILIQINSIGMFMNLMPFFKTDGYYILSDLVSIDNLFQRSLEYCGKRTSQLLTGKKPETIETPTAREKKWFWIQYGLVMIFMVTQLPISIYFAMSFFGDLSAIGYLLMYIGLARLVMTFGASLVKKFRGMGTATRNRPILRQMLRRYAWLAPTVLLFIPIPYFVYASGTIIPARAVDVRNRVEGVVEEVFVREGSCVQAGTVLVRLRNPSLELEAAQSRWALVAAQERSKMQLSGLHAAEARIEMIRLEQAMLTFQQSMDRYASAEERFGKSLLSEDELRNLRDRAELERKSFERARAAFDWKIAGPDSLQIAIAGSNVERTLSRLKELEIKRQHLVVVAESDGCVATERPAQIQGSYVPAGSLLLSLHSRALAAEMYLAEEEVGDVNVKSHFKFQAVSAGSATQGVITEISPAAIRSQESTQKRGRFPAQSVVRVKGEFRETPPEAWYPGVSAEGRIYSGIHMLGYVAFKKAYRAVKNQFWASL